MAYSTETGNKNIKILVESLKLNQASGGSVIFENESLFVLSPSVQNTRNRFDINLVNIEKARINNKRSLLIVRYFDKLLVGDLDEFLSTMTIENSMYTHGSTRKWQYTIRKSHEGYFITLQKARGLEFKLIKKSAQELIKKYSNMPAGEGDLKLGKTIKSPMSVSHVISHIHSYIISKGFNYSIRDIQNLYLSIRSKPFVIISGVSGTGKTKIVQLFAESLGATEKNGQFSLIPVRPDWSDGSELLGYRDIKGDFIRGPLIKIIENAIEYPELPHFVLLDEMNLARVEYYFSDLLSVMESRRREDEQIVSSRLLEEKVDGRYLHLPENLIIIGTVNMDETTHPFSKKVLDRANTIEFNEINLESFAHLRVTEDAEMVALVHEHISANYISLKDVFENHEQLVIKTSEKLAEINRLLEPLNAHVGYRVRDEICFYLVHNEETELLSEEEAFDFCLMQKILPRITGGDDRVDVLLNNLFEWLTNRPYEMDDGIDESKYPSKYPRSAWKVAEMLRGYHADGFTSYWIT